MKHFRLGSFLIFTAFSTISVASGCRGSNLEGDEPSETPLDVSAEGEVVFSPSGRAFDSSVEVDLSSSESGSIIYTLDGTEPGQAGGATLQYSGPISVEQSSWIRARVRNEDGGFGKESSENYIRLGESVDGFSSSLPLVVIDSRGRDIDREAEGERPYRPLLTVFIEPDESTGRATLSDAPNYAGYAGMHVRGNSSADYEKLQYKLEIWDEYREDKNAALLGMPEESDWVLHAPYSDKSLMRNYLMFKWSNDLGRYAPRTRFVELFIRSQEGAVSMDDYRGVYLLVEKIKRDDERVAVEQLETSDDSEPEVSGGYLLSHDWEEEGERYEEFETDFVTDLFKDRINFEYPKPDKITAAQRDWIKNYIDAFEQSLDSTTLSDGDDGYAQYIDVASFADFMLLIELSRNVDGYVLSTFMHKPRGGKLAMGPVWDFNGSLGNANYFSSEEIDGWHYTNEEFPADNPEAFAWWERLLADPAYVELRAERWNSARDGVLSTAQMMADIDAVAAVLEEAQARNFERWPVLGEEVWPNDPGAEDRQTYEEEVDYLKQWVSDRASWIDSAVR